MKLIRPEMTPKERALAYAKGEEVDRIPATLSAGETISPLYGISMLDYYFSADTMVEVQSRIAEDFCADNMGIGLGLRTLIEALGTKLSYKENDVSTIEKPAFENIDELENRGLVDVEKDGRLPIITEAFERLMEKYGDERNLGSGMAGPLTTAAGLIGTVKFLKGTVKDKEGIHRLMQYSTDNVVKCARDLHKKLGIKFMLSEPLASKNLISKKQFNEFFLPYLIQSVERMNEFQGGTGIHICGVTHDRWQEVVDAGINSFWVDNCESMEELKNLYGRRIAVSGNVVPVEVLRNGTKESIEADVRRCLKEAADNPCGFTLTPGCTTPVGTPKENMIAYMNAACIYGKGARKGHMPRGMQEYI